ncbi:MAG TPA: hypothetical protein VLI05_02355 [Candidatus Saccharimonadia bacterium]|nr:hypothetical protein [Candidatus Saccharimonadia bacterium]
MTSRQELRTQLLNGLIQHAGSSPAQANFALGRPTSVAVSDLLPGPRPTHPELTSLLSEIQGGLTAQNLRAEAGWEGGREDGHSAIILTQIDD